MWLFWIVWACVCAPVSLHLCVCMRAHTHIRLSASAYCMRSCARLRLCVCAAVSNSALTAVGSSQPGCDLSVYLSTFSLSFCFIFFFSQSFSSKSLCSASLFWSHFIFSSSLLPCLFFFLLWASYCLFTPMPSPSLPLSYSTPLFLLKYFQSLTSLWLVFTSQPFFFLKTLPWFFFFKILACGVKWNITQKNILYRMFSCLLYF